MKKRAFLNATLSTCALAVAALASPSVFAQSTFKVGLILPMTGQQASTGKQISAAAKLYMAQNGSTVAGRKIELIIKDDTSVPDVTKRVAQELVVQDRVDAVAGFGITPSAFATAPIATQAKIPMIVMAAGTSSITNSSPFIVRTSFTLPQSAVAMADWAVKNKIKKAVTLVSDYGPGIDAEKFFIDQLKANGGQVPEALRVPLRDPDFSAALQKARDHKPDALYVFVPSGAAATVAKQFLERGLDKAGIKLIGPGDITDDDQLNDMGDGVIGVVTAHMYSADHPSAKNKAFVDAFKKANGFRPNFMAVGGYDGMHVVYEGLKVSKGKGGADLVNAMKTLKWESPRGPISIDPETRDIVQNIYLRKVEKKGGELYNVEFDVIRDVKDPGKIKK